MACLPDTGRRRCAGAPVRRVTRHLCALAVAMVAAGPALAQPARWSLALDARATQGPSLPLRLQGDGARILVVVPGRRAQRIEIVTQGPGAGLPDAPRPRLADLDGDGPPDLLLPAVVAMRHEEWQAWIQTPGRRFVLAGTLEAGTGAPIRRDRWGYVAAGNGSGGLWVTTLHSVARGRRLVPVHRVTRRIVDGPGGLPCGTERLPAAERPLAESAFQAYCRP